MPQTIRLSIPHELGRAEARRRIEEGFGQLGRQFGGDGKIAFTQTWAGDRLAFSAKVLCQAIAGRLEVLDQAVQMEVDLPSVLAMLAERIKGRLQRQGQVLLEKK